MATYKAYTDYTAEAEDIARRRKIAEQLQARALEPIKQETAGGYVVPISWTQGLAKVLQGGMGAYDERKLKDESKVLSAGRNQALAEALGAMPKGTAAVPEQRISEDGEELIMPPQAAQEPTMQDNASWMARLAQVDPQAVQIGGSMLGMQQKAQENDENRALRRDMGQQAREAAILQLQMRADNERLSRAERDAAAAERERLRAQDRSEAQQRQFEQDRRMREFMVANRPPVQPQPLVQVMGENGQPQWVERSAAIGKTPAGAGSKAEATAAGKSDVDADVVKLKSALDELKSTGGITDTSKGAMSNIGAAISSSGVGQMLSGAVGSNAQKSRDTMLMIRPSLLRSIMQSTGMSAKQMDSNAELKLWLSTATDPTKSYQANMEALNNIAAKYGSGPIMDAQSGGASGGWESIPKGIDKKVWDAMTTQERALFK